MKALHHYDLLGLLKPRRTYWPGWKDLYRDVEAALGQDPASHEAQALAARWMELSGRGSGGDPEVQAGGIQAWADRENWPAPLRQRVSEYKLEELASFIGKAIVAHRKKYYSEEAWAKLTERTAEERAPISAEWHALFLEAGAALADDPAGERAQHLARRWRQLAERSAGGQPELGDYVVQP